LNKEYSSFEICQLFPEVNLLQEITIINLSLPFKMGNVNCYLIKTSSGFVLIDAGSSNQQTEIERELDSAGYQLGALNLIVLTHGDFDHSGNAAYLHEKFGAKIAMHLEDRVMVEQGDMFGNRQKANNIITRKLVPIFFEFGKSHRFKPDIYLDEGDDLSEHGLEAEVLGLPGHSKGSIGILTAAGDLFCGDLLENTKQPGLNSLMDDPVAAKTSVEKIKELEIYTVYPGHGEPFAMDQFIKNKP
jgi:glyoxylase-like metal-dependent hydrolase (beta-lactamase superfamily II)